MQRVNKLINLIIGFLFTVANVYGVKWTCSFDKRCICENQTGYSNLTVDCSYKKLSALPKFPRASTVVDCRFNNITSIPNKHFEENDLLQELHLSYNKLHYLTNESFLGLNNLKILTLNNNNISDIIELSFVYLQQLKNLNIKNNNISLLSLNLTLLPSLYTLRADLVKKTNTAFNIEPPVGVKILDVSGLSGDCSIKHLTSETFRPFVGLEELDISACMINTVEQGTFRYMTNLTMLNVSFNTCLRFAGLENITIDLPYTAIKVLKINKIHKTFDMNTKLMQSHVKHLQDTKLIELYIDSNRIQQVENNATNMLPKTLRKISMAENEFSFGEYILESFNLSVEFVNLSFLFNTHNIFEKQEKCDTELKGRSNDCKRAETDTEIKGHSNDCKRAETDTEIKGHSNYCKRTETDFKLPDIHTSYSHPFPKNLSQIVYRQCRLQYKIPKMAFSENILESVDAAFNIFYSWEGPLLNFSKLRYIDLSNNFCSYVSKVFFQGFPNLKELYVQNNFLGFVLQDDTDGEILQYVTKLEIINLAENKISRLPENFFKSQKRLRQINIEGNMLDDLTLQVIHMEELSYLDLSNNRFSSLDKRARTQLETLFEKNGNLTLNMSGNPLRCACDTMEFVKWIAFTTVRFSDIKSYYCKTYNGTKISFSDPKRVYEQLRKKCSSYTSLIIVLVTTLILFLVFLAWGLVYRHRWKLRYFYYMMKNKYRKNKWNTIDYDENTYKYDAFISYEDRDRFFVHENLVDKLEKHGGLKLCLHKRDFLPGNDISENIITAIHDSRKVVCVLSYNFFDSYWCMFEYNMARVESIYSRNKENIMFLVFLEEIASKDLPFLILEHVQSQSYIEYPNNEDGNVVFWEKLIQILS